MDKYMIQVIDGMCDRMEVFAKEGSPSVHFLVDLQKALEDGGFKGTPLIADVINGCEVNLSEYKRDARWDRFFKAYVASVHSAWDAGLPIKTFLKLVAITIRDY